jgi:hypothetical protein
VTISVTDAPAPVFTWVPACRASILSVFDTDAPDGSAAWIVSMRINEMLPGVTYGEPPVGTLEEVNAVPLVPGRRYTVILQAESFGTLGTAGVLTFTR